MSLDDELYREWIMDHFRNPRNRGRMEGPSLCVTGKNPLCGDQLELAIKVDGDTIADLKQQAHGCAISQASASMMSEAVKCQTLAEAERLAGLFKKMMLEHGSPDAFPPSMEDAKALEGVRELPVRVKCALLAWNSILEAIELLRKEKSNGHGR